MIRQVLAVVFFIAALFAAAQRPSAKSYEQIDSVATVVVESDSVPQKRGFVHRVLDYFKDSNKPKEYKKFDFSVIGGPHYSSDTKFGIGIAAAGFYRPNMADSLTMPSNVSLYGDISTVGFYLIGLKGNHLFRHDKRRINYNLYFYSFPRKFWGIGYENGLDMNNATKFNEIYIHANVDMMWQFAPKFYAGPAIEFSHSKANKVVRPELWNGQDFSTFTTGVGMKVQYDTRDNLTATQNGWLLMLEQRFCPRFLGNRYAFSYTSFQANWFKNMWKGGVLGVNYHARASYG
nr:BamA/TamA family outer membrane protein [Paramuribaculum sp.]